MLDAGGEAVAEAACGAPMVAILYRRPVLISWEWACSGDILYCSVG